MRSLRAGDSVRIYTDPVTEMKLEGDAVLIAPKTRVVDGFQLWSVAFPNDDGETVQRVVKVPDWELRT